MRRHLEPDRDLPLAPGQDSLEHRVHAVSRHLGPAPAADRLAGPCEQEPQVIGHLGGRADGGAAGLGGRSLTDGERGGQPVDLVVVGPGQPFQELFRVRGDALDVAALPFGVDGVEGERGLPRTAHPRHHGQGRSRELDVDILEVVLAGAVEPDELDLFHLRGSGHGAILTEGPPGWCPSGPEDVPNPECLLLLRSLLLSSLLLPRHRCITSPLVGYAFPA